MTYAAGKFVSLQRKYIESSHYFVISIFFRLLPHDREAALSALADTEYM